MKNKFLSRILAGFGFFILTLSLFPQAHAIGIRPIRYEVNVKPGETIESTVTVVNETDKDFSAEPTLLTFYRNDINGFPIFVAEKDPEFQDVSKWVEISQDPVLVPAKGSKDVKYKINVPEDATPGGKYISIAYQPVKETTDSVKVNVRAASLVLLNVEGEIVRKGEVNNFELPGEQYSDKPFSFNFNFLNTGNTHVKPIGSITIIDQETGKKLTKLAHYVDPQTGEEIVSDGLPININKSNVLPNSDRIFNVPWDKNVKEGKFRAKLDLSYDTSQPPLQQEINFEIKDLVTVNEFKINTENNKADFEITLTNEGKWNQKVNGAISIKNSFGYQVDEIPLPEDMGYLAAGETRNVKVEWLNTNVPSGRYKAELKGTYGFTKKEIEEVIKFGQWDMTKVGLIVALIIVSAIALISILKGRSRRRATRKR